MATVNGSLTSTFIQKESTYGTYPSTWDNTTATKLHFSKIELPIDKVYVEDPALLGNTYPADKIPTATKIEGSMDFSVHPEQLGHLLYLGLGADKGVIVAPLGCVVVCYDGAQESCLLALSGNNLTASVGALGAEVADTNFNTTGTIDVSNASFDTLTELANAINGYTGYNAYLIGSGSTSCARLTRFSAVQAKLNSVKMEAKEDSFITITYTGAQDSCLIAKSGNNLTSKIGALGAEAPDAAFGTGGTIDLSNASFDTMSELAAAIDGYADYTATVTNLGTYLTSTIADFTDTQAKTASGITKEAVLPTRAAYRHRFVPTGLGEQKPSFSIRVNKSVENVAYTGCKIGELTFNFEPRQLLTGSAELVAQNYQSVAALTGISIENNRAFVTSNVKMYINGELQSDVKKVTLKNNPNLDKEDTVLGTEYIAEPDNQQGALSLEAEFRYNSETLAIKTKYLAGTEVEVVLYGSSADTVETGKNYDFWIRIPRCKISTANAEISGPEKLVMPVTFDGMTPLYNDFDAIEWDLVTGKSSY